MAVAKFGYDNIRVKHDGREIRTIAVDPERAPFVRLAFELYATGNYSFPDLRDALTDAGCRTRGTAATARGPSPSPARQDAQAIGTTSDTSSTTVSSTPADTNRSSPKTCSTRCRRCSARSETPERVSACTTTTSRAPSGAPGAGAGSSCGPPQARPARSTATSSAAECRNATATFPRSPSPRSSAPSSTTTRSSGIPQRHRETLTAIAAAVTADSGEATARLANRCAASSPNSTRRKTDGSTSSATRNGRSRKSRRGCKPSASKQRITHQLKNTADDLEPGRAVLTTALDLLDRPRDLYDAATDDDRKALNKAIFNRLYLDSTDRRPHTTADALREPFGSLVLASRTVRADGTQGRSPAHRTPSDQATKHLGGLLALCLEGQSASKAAMVELRGFEPLTPSMRTRCATGLRHSPNGSQASTEVLPASNQPFTARRRLEALGGVEVEDPLDLLRTPRQRTAAAPGGGRRRAAAWTPAAAPAPDAARRA